MTGHVTNHVAEVAVAGQLQITVRASQGELEIGQEYDGEWHGIYVQPDNVLTLIQPKDRRRAKLRDGGGNDRDMNRDDVTVQEPLRLVAAE
jgi:hypothetical protein